eukprot:12538742-Alexandrium_andersonii.AAC.1
MQATARATRPRRQTAIAAAGQVTARGEGEGPWSCGRHHRAAATNFTQRGGAPAAESSTHSGAA